MGTLNEDLYMLKLQGMSSSEIDTEVMLCRRQWLDSSNRGEQEIASLMYQRLECIEKYEQMLRLLNV